MIVENLKIWATIGAKSSIKWFVAIAVGTVFSIICFIYAIIKLIGTLTHDYVSFWEMIKFFFTQNTANFILLISAPLFVVAYFWVANALFVETAIHLAWKYKVADFVEPKIATLFTKLSKNQPNWMAKISSQAELKLKLLEVNNQTPESSSIKQKITNFVLKQINLNDLNLNNPETNVPEVLSQRVKLFISEFTEPSFLFFWIVFGIQLLLLVWSWA